MTPRNYKPRKPVTPDPASARRAMIFSFILAGALAALAAGLIVGGN